MIQSTPMTYSMSACQKQRVLYRDNIITSNVCIRIQAFYKEKVSAISIPILLNGVSFRLHLSATGRECQKQAKRQLGSRIIFPTSKQPTPDIVQVFFKSKSKPGNSESYGYLAYSHSKTKLHTYWDRKKILSIQALGKNFIGLPITYIRNQEPVYSSDPNILYFDCVYPLKYSNTSKKSSLKQKLFC